MALEDKPDTGDHQDPLLNWLAHWYEQPQGRRVRARLLERIRCYGEPGPGDLAVELAPVPILEESDVLRAPLVRISAVQPLLLADPIAWPIESASARRIVLAHACARSPDAAAVVAEAARVLEPEGRIFLLEGNQLQQNGKGVRASSLPEGLRRGHYRALLEHEGLSVLDQWSLSLLPPGLPPVWQQRLAAMDIWRLKGFPPVASMILTVGHKRVNMPLRPAPHRRLWMPRPAVRPGLVPSRSRCSGARRSNG